ncbi:MAG: TauD/TfdA family dioxygenase [Kiloniellales bacterium]|nr:TauD/TfdA family dioxygenase [Kiloniellales bacterium]
MDIIPLTGALGAEILGADLRLEDDYAAIHAAFVRYSVVVVRAQSLTPDDHLAFARRFGTINVNRFFQRHATHPEIALVTKQPEQRHAVGEGWHTDHSYDAEPAMGSLLYAVEVPETGGDTLFVSMAAAYDALSAPLRSFLGTLSAWHSSRHVFGFSQAETEGTLTGRYGNPDAAVQDALHPVVIAHPLSQRAGLYVNPVFTTRIDGLGEDESAALLEMIYRHCQNPDFHCRVRWRAGDLTIWDNRATWHKAINDYHGQRRRMHRVTVDGCALEAAAVQAA